MDNFKSGITDSKKKKKKTKPVTWCTVKKIQDKYQIGT